MNCYCKDEFDWLMNMIKEGGCFRTFKEFSSFIDSSLKELRYMRKRFGYLFYNELARYIAKYNREKAILVHKQERFVARDPYDNTIIVNDDNGYFINGPRPYDDRERYDFVYLDDIDKGEPFVTEDDKFRDDCVKKKNKKNLIKKINDKTWNLE